MVNFINKIQVPVKFILLGTQTGKIYYIEDFGNGNFGIPSLIAQLEGAVDSIGVGDFDNDGDFDFIIGNTMNIFINDGNNIFMMKDLNIPGFDYLKHDIVVNDINDDGLMDFFAGVPGYNVRDYCLINKGNFKFQPIPMPDLLLGYQSYSTYGKDSGDFNEDGKIDIAIDTSHYYSKISTNEFIKNFIYYEWYRTHYLILATDYDKDSHYDLIVGGHLYYGNGEGDFYLGKDHNLPKQGDLNDGFLHDMDQDNAIVRDFDNDKYDDILCLKNYTGEVYLFKGNENAIDFTSNPIFTVNESALGISAYPKSIPFYLERPNVKLNDPYLDLQPVKGVFTIKGIISGDIQEYVLEYGKGMKPENWVILDQGNSVIDGNIYNWDTTGLNGIYTLRLKAIDSQNRLKSDEILIDIVNSVSHTNDFIVFGNKDGIYRAMYNTLSSNFNNKEVVGYPVNGHFNGMGIADFDNDGDYDVISGKSWYSINIFEYLMLYINDGDNNFTETRLKLSNVNLNNDVHDFAIGDFNNDGWMDFVCSGYSPDNYLFINQKNNTFRMRSLGSVPQILFGKDTADFNNDGYLDIITGDAIGNYYIYFNDKAEGFIRSAPFAGPSTGQMFTVVAGDFNEDGFQDMILGGNIGEAFLYFGNGTSEFIKAEDSSLPSEKPIDYGRVFKISGNVSADKFDYDKDGHLDLIANTGSAVYFIKGNGDGSFQAPEIITAYSGGGYAISAMPQKSITDMPIAEITSPDEDGTEGSKWEINITGSAHGSYFTNYILEYGYGDNPENWTLITNSTTPVTGIYLNDKLKKLWPSYLLNGIYTIRLRVYDTIGRMSRDTVTFNILNTTDDTSITNRRIIIIGNQDGELYCFEENEDGTFTNKQYLGDIGDMAYGVSVLDLDNDGDLDFIANEKNGDIYGFINNGRQKFVKVEIDKYLQFYSDAMDILGSDFNKDYNRDFIVSQNDDVPIEYNNFTKLEFDKINLPALPSGQRIRKKEVIDINNDDKNDLICIDYNGNIFIYTNKSTSHKIIFSIPVYNFSVTYFPYTFLSGDFDEDGINDLIIGGDVNGDTYFYKGDSSGGFALQAGITPFDFNNYTSADVMDFNGDGYLDIIAVDFIGKHFYYIQGKFSAQFETPVLIDPDVGDALGISNLDDLKSFTNVPPMAIINEPDRDENVNGLIYVSGVAYDSDFVRYRLEYCDNPLYTNWILIKASSNVVESADLGLWDTTLLPIGVYYIQLSVLDAIGQETITFINVNLVPPQAESIVLDPSSPIKATNVQVTLTVDEPIPLAPELYFIPEGKSDKIYIILTNASTNDIIWQGSFTVTTQTGDGEARFYYEAEDDFGNIGNTILQGDRFIIDTISPSCTILINPASPVNTGIIDVECQLSENIKDIPNIYFTPNNSTNKILIPNISKGGNLYSGQMLITTDMSNGPAYFTFNAVDLAGNIGTNITSGKDFIIGIDRVKPTAIIYTPNSNDIVVGEVAITGTATDQDYSGLSLNFSHYILEYGERDNPTNWVEIRRGTSTVISNSLGDWDTVGLSGFYTLRLRSIDRNFNISEDRVYVNVNPLANIVLITPASNSTISNKMPVFKWEIPPEPDNKYLNFKLVIARDEGLTDIVYTFKSTNKRQGFIPLTPVKPGKGNEYFQMFNALELNQDYYWKVWAWNGDAYYINSIVWKFRVE